MMRTTPLSPEKALVRLEAACAKAERCSGELRDKLRMWGIAPTDADDIMESLRKRRFYDDARFASAFVRDKYRFSRWGRRKIAYALAVKRIPRAVVDEALAEIDEEEYVNILEALIRVKRASLPPGEASTPEGRARIFRFLASRGFESELISRCMKRV